MLIPKSRVEKMYYDVTHYLVNNPGVSIKKAREALGVTPSQYQYGRDLAERNISRRIIVLENWLAEEKARATRLLDKEKAEKAALITALEAISQIVQNINGLQRPH